MCKFCKDIATGNDWVPLKIITFDYGILGKNDAYMAIQRNTQGEPSLVIGMASLGTYGDDFIEKYKKIKYCPMCGRKLK